MSMKIYKGYVEEGPGQYPIRKTQDWVEDLGPLSSKIKYAAWKGFQIGTFYSIFDIRTISRLSERKAIFARYCFFTIPITSMFAGWMGGVEASKLLLGPDYTIHAHGLGALVPGGIWSLWRKGGSHGVFIRAIPFALVGMAYANAVKYNRYWSLLDAFNNDNPNMPTGYLMKDWSFFGNVNRSEYADKKQIWFHPKDPGPSWKKWDPEEEAKWAERDTGKDWD